MATDPVPAQPQMVLLIHGTGAGDPLDSGTKWWQRESPFWSDMNRHIAPRAACGPSDGQVFHWSGANSERARRAAGRLLYRWLRSFDDRGQEYHVVGHSHGGSVMWYALLESMKAGHPLRHLQSWTTVGTDRKSVV
jgi:pimeloyl-ACP methyl ester carboxylesterase